jgi:hypothetical protein
MFDSMLSALEKELLAALKSTVAEMILTARTRLEGAVADIVKERAEGLAEVAEERTKGLADVDTRRGELSREIGAVQTHQATQDGRVELNIGGYRFQTSVQTLRRVPHTFFDAYFSGRYAQDVCADGSIFVDRDGKHIGHVLEYMRDGVVSVAVAGAQPSVSLLRTLKREFGFYCIELVAEQSTEAVRPEMAYVLGGNINGNENMSSMEQYDVSSGQWSAVAAMSVRRRSFGACVVQGEIYVTGKMGDGNAILSSVEKYSPSTDTWSVVVAMPTGRSSYCPVSVGSAIYVIGGFVAGAGVISSVFKFDSTQGTWTHVPPMPEARYAFAACVIGGDIFIFGGGTAGTITRVSAFKYDMEATVWSTLEPMPCACIHHSAQVLNGLVYIVGAGENGSAVLRFDPATECGLRSHQHLCPEIIMFPSS